MNSYVTIGDVEFRIDMIARALGIPAATLEKLAAGEWVAVPKPNTTMRVGSPGESQAIKVLIPSTLLITTYGCPFVLEAFPIAATEPGHD